MLRSVCRLQFVKAEKDHNLDLVKNLLGKKLLINLGWSSFSALGASLRVMFNQAFVHLQLDMVVRPDSSLGYYNLAAWVFLSFTLHFGAFHFDFIMVLHLTLTIHSSRLNYCYSLSYLLRLPFLSSSLVHHLAETQRSDLFGTNSPFSF